MPDQLTTELPPALRRAMDLLADPPAEPDAGSGYLDLLKDVPRTDVALAEEHRRRPGGVGVRTRFDAL